MKPDFKLAWLIAYEYRPSDNPNKALRIDEEKSILFFSKEEPSEEECLDYIGRYAPHFRKDEVTLVITRVTKKGLKDVKVGELSALEFQSLMS